MTDQCTHCIRKGDIKGCLRTPCSYHELWMVKELIEKAQLLFSSIICVSAEGPEFMGKLDLCDAIIKEAGKGYDLCSEALGKE